MQHSASSNVKLSGCWFWTSDSDFPTLFFLIFIYHLNLLAGVAFPFNLPPASFATEKEFMSRLTWGVVSGSCGWLNLGWDLVGNFLGVMESHAQEGQGHCPAEAGQQNCRRQMEVACSAICCLPQGYELGMLNGLVVRALGGTCWSTLVSNFLFVLREKRNSVGRNSMLEAEASGRS